MAAFYRNVTCTRAYRKWWRGYDEQTGEIKVDGGWGTTGKGKWKELLHAPFRGGTVVGSKRTFPAYWFERLMGELGTSCGWATRHAFGRATCAIRSGRARCRASVEHLLAHQPLPAHLGSVPGGARDLRQLLVHRMKQVRARTQVKNQLHALAISQGVCRKSKLWSVKGRKELDSLALLPWAARRRKELLESLDRLDEQVRQLDRAVEEAGREREEVALLRTHPGVGMVVGPGLRADGGTHRALPQQPQAGELLAG